MTIRTKLICLGGPLHGRHVELDPLAHEYRCEVLEDGDKWELPQHCDPKPYFVNSTRHTYVRRGIVTGHDLRLEFLMLKGMRFHEVMLKVFGYDE